MRRHRKALILHSRCHSLSVIYPVIDTMQTISLLLLVGALFYRLWTLEPDEALRLSEQIKSRFKRKKT